MSLNCFCLLPGKKCNIPYNPIIFWFTCSLLLETPHRGSSYLLRNSCLRVLMKKLNVFLVRTYSLYTGVYYDVAPEWWDIENNPAPWKYRNKHACHWLMTNSYSVLVAVLNIFKPDTFTKFNFVRNSLHDGYMEICCDLKRMRQHCCPPNSFRIKLTNSTVIIVGEPRKIAKLVFCANILHLATQKDIWKVDDCSLAKPSL